MTRTMYDSDRASAIPTFARIVAGYIDGLNPWTGTDWGRFPNAIRVGISRRDFFDQGHVLDVEPGISTWPPSTKTIAWVQRRRAAGVEPTIYCNWLNDWAGLRQLFQHASVREPNWWVSRYRYNPDGSIPSIPPGAIGLQYANETLHKQGHFDLSVMADHWPGVDEETGVNWNDEVFVSYPAKREDGVTRRVSEVIGDPYILWMDALKTGTEFSLVDMRDDLTAIKAMLADFFDYAKLGKVIVDIAAERGIVGLSPETFRAMLTNLRVSVDTPPPA